MILKRASIAIYNPLSKMIKLSMRHANALSHDYQNTRIALIEAKAYKTLFIPILQGSEKDTLFIAVTSYLNEVKSLEKIEIYLDEISCGRIEFMEGNGIPKLVPLREIC